MFQKKSYHEKVYEVVRLIPEGKVSTYGHIADYLTLGASRMVGWALKNSKMADDVPAHRVVNRKGELTGRHHWPTPTMMAELLESEGVPVADNQVVDFKDRLWIPADHLEM